MYIFLEMRMALNALCNSEGLVMAFVPNNPCYAGV